LVLHSYGVVVIPSHRGCPRGRYHHNSCRFFNPTTPSISIRLIQKVAINEAGSALVAILPSTVGNKKTSKESKGKIGKPSNLHYNNLVCQYVESHTPFA
jgi:hypothetical protein